MCGVVLRQASALPILLAICLLRNVCMLPFRNVACAFAFSDWHANFEVCVIFLVLRAMMQHERLATDVPG